MEPARYSIVIHDVLVVDVKERLKYHWISGKGAEALFRSESLGWYITLIGSREALYIGDTKPNIAADDLVTIRIEKQ